MRRALSLALMMPLVTAGLSVADTVPKLPASPLDLKRYTLSDGQERSLKADVAYDLVDPESARFRNIRSAIAADGMIVICGELNAKNRMGGYTGFTLFVAGRRASDHKWAHVISDDKTASVMLARCIADGLAEPTRQ